MVFPRIPAYFIVILLAVACAEEPRPADPQHETTASPKTALRDEAEDHPLPPLPLPTSYASVEIRDSSNGIRDVFVYSQNITRFGNPQHIYLAEVSSTERYLMVWHMDYTPRKVSIYDLDSDRRISHFIPGAGGRLSWTAGDLIYHEYGAGTNTYICHVYDIEGTRRWGTYTSGGELCASGQYVLVYPSLPLENMIGVLDVSSGATLAGVRVEGIANTLAHSWLDGNTIRFWYSDLANETRSIDLRLKPTVPSK